MEKAYPGSVLEMKDTFVSLVTEGPFPCDLSDFQGPTTPRTLSRRQTPHASGIQANEFGAPNADQLTGSHTAVDKIAPARLIGASCAAPPSPSFVFASSAPAAAMVGNAYVVPNAASRPEVMLIGSHGNFCTGVAIARDLVLTAAHCVPAGAEFKQVELDAERKPIMKDVLAWRATRSSI